MKTMRKCLAVLLALTLCLSLLPAAALAAEGDAPGTETPGCTCETACTADAMNAACPVCGAEGAAPENCGQYQAPKPTAAEQVQAMIAALPTAEALAAMTQAEQGAVYTDLQAAWDAYEALSDEEKLEVTGTEIFDALFAVFNGMTNALAAEYIYLITGGTPSQDYTLDDSTNTLTINSNTPLTISTNATDAITGQIVVAQNVNAKLTLNMVNISAPEGKSAIELSSGSSLTLTLTSYTSNSLTGGNCGSSALAGAPGIHVPQDATLTVLCAAAGDNSSHICDSTTSHCGKLTITGGSNSTGIGGVGIGGGIPTENSGNYTGQPCGTVMLLGGDIIVTGAAGQGGNAVAKDIGGSNGQGSGSGGSGGTVIILTSVENSSGSLNIGGGSGITYGDTGAGIKPSSSGDNTYEVYGDLTLPDNLTIPAGVTVNIPSGATLTVPSGKTLTNNGTIVNNGMITVDSGGTLTNNGDVSGSGSLTNNGTVNKKQQAATAPTTNDVTTTEDSITVQTVAGQKYACTQSNSAPGTGAVDTWKEADATGGSLTFDSLTANTTYYLWTYMPAGDTNYYEDSAVSTALAVTTTAVQQTSLTEGNTYWFDLSDVGIPGTVNSALPGGLSWVPFTYVGAVDAYVLNSSSNGVADASDTASSTTDSTGTYGYAYSHSLFIADYNVTYDVSWDELNNAGLIFGEEYSSDGVTYTLRAPTVGNTDSNSTVTPANNECDKILEKDSGSYIKNLSGQWFWGQDTYKSNTVHRTMYGNDITYGNSHIYYFSTTKQPNLGYRPVLELPADSTTIGLTTVTINLNGGSLNGSTESVTLVVKSGQSFTAPSGDGLTAPAGQAFGGWKDGSGNVYGAGESVSSGVTSLTAWWIDIPVITTQPKSATYYVGETAEPLTVKASVNDGGLLIYVWFGTTQEDLSESTLLDDHSSDSYTPPTTAAGTTYYYCVVVNYHDGKDARIASNPVAITVQERNSSTGGGGSSNPSYSITVPSDIEGGSVTVRPTRAERGDTVTITVEPDAGYVLDELTATDKNGDELRLTEKSENKFTFKMPASRVTVYVSFVETAPEPTPEPEPNVLPFADVPEGAWYEDAVRYVYENGLMTGTGADTFAPDQPTSRAMIATILWRMAGSPVVNYLMDYDDVDPSAWYGEAVRWASSAGVVTGYGDGTFGPDALITREQLAVMLYRFAAFRGYDVSAGGMAVREFDDYGDISDWALEAMAWAVDAGLLGGKEGNVLDPAGTATRAEVAAVLQRFLENLN